MAVNPFNNKQPVTEKEQTVIKQAAWDDVMSDSRTTGLTEKDYGDPEKHARKARLIIVIVTALVLVGLAVAGYLYIRHAVDIRQEQLANSSSVTTKAPEQKKLKETQDETKKNGGFNNPAAKSENVGEAAKGDIQISVNKNTVSIKADGKENLLTVPALTKDVKAVSTPCELKDVASNCYLGDSEVNGKNVKVWVFRDASSSALISSDKDVKETTANGAGVAFMRQVPFNNKNMTGLFIVNADQTGFLLASDDQNAINSIASGDSSFKVTSSN